MQGAREWRGSHSWGPSDFKITSDHKQSLASFDLDDHPPFEQVHCLGRLESPWDLAWTRSPPISAVVVIVTIRYHNQLDKEEYETEEAAILHGAGRTYLGKLEMPSSSSLDWGGSYVSRTHG
ncbi:hypothetical protein MLD38_000308 [Melastoma candidum]|uniref:Uncharacterized protein n=1 Tax=Melastoma candidum TaxID=119954 RepID=A0ACB9S9Q8_9MYRT|nr:hypothetical protein MLD38_000308 [Melastoma candidum]